MDTWELHPVIWSYSPVLNCESSNPLANSFFLSEKILLKAVIADRLSACGSNDGKQTVAFDSKQIPNLRIAHDVLCAAKKQAGERLNLANLDILSSRYGI